MHVYTLSIDHADDARLIGIHVINVTSSETSPLLGLRRSLWNSLMSYTMSETAVIDTYYEDMRTSYNLSPADWHNLVSQESPIGLACEGEISGFFHKEALLDILSKICRYHNVPFVHVGDFPSVK